MEILDQRVSASLQLQDHLSQVGNFVRWTQEFIVGPQVEITRVLALSDQCVVTVTLEVVFLVIKGHIMRVTPDLTVTRS